MDIPAGRLSNDSRVKRFSPVHHQDFFASITSPRPEPSARRKLKEILVFVCAQILVVGVAYEVSGLKAVATFVSRLHTPSYLFPFQSVFLPYLHEIYVHRAVHSHLVLLANALVTFEHFLPSEPLKIVLEDCFVHDAGSFA